MSSFNWNENVCDDIGKYGYVVINHEIEVAPDFDVESEPLTVFYTTNPGVGWEDENWPPEDRPESKEDAIAMLEERRDYYRERWEEAEETLKQARLATAFRDLTE